jgi:hypothetical protein
VAEIPEIPGWSVARGESGTWLARRCGTLTPTQLEYGARLVVGANSFGELGVNCLAEDVKAGFIATAEELARGMAEAEFKRQADAEREEP